MKFIKTHKVICIIIGIMILMLIAGLVIFIKLSPDGKKNAFGNRLTGIENYPINEESMKNMMTEALQVEGIQAINYNVKGRTVNILVTVVEQMSKENAIAYANKTLEYFTDEIKSYYDIQIFISTDTESEIYPIMGYKHKTRDTYVWKQE